LAEATAASNIARKAARACVSSQAMRDFLPRLPG
jgi:hypothetical protein